MPADRLRPGCTSVAAPGPAHLVNARHRVGTWGIGPFDNDTATDFSYTLDVARSAEREQVLRGVLTRTVKAVGYLTEAEEAVAAAALIAAQCPDGEPVDTAYGPEQPVPHLREDISTCRPASRGVGPRHDASCAEKRSSC